jgi:hypothetical protein
VRSFGVETELATIVAHVMQKVVEETGTMRPVLGSLSSIGTVIGVIGGTEGTGRLKDWVSFVFYSELP